MCSFFTQADRSRYFVFATEINPPNESNFSRIIRPSSVLFGIFRQKSDSANTRLVYHAYRYHHHRFGIILPSTSETVLVSGRPNANLATIIIVCDLFFNNCSGRWTITNFSRRAVEWPRLLFGRTIDEMIDDITSRYNRKKSLHASNDLTALDVPAFLR